MPHQFSALTFTPAVQAVQTEMGSRAANLALNQRGPANDTLGPDERAFIAARDGFYLATVGESGWPYVQFRGGPAGFLTVIDDHTLAYADVIGNRQYISTGNLRANPRAALFLMDYPHQTRLKILGTVEVTPWAEAGDWKLALPMDSRARPERVIRIHVAAFDWNCPQHIPQRWTLDELEHSPIGERVQSLTAENAALRRRLAELESRASL
jgi:predicted pyridoxine 5'-phosphate oxidase superfamily flavin-nucleotide-binding protein